MHRIEVEAQPACLDAVHRLLDVVWEDAPEVPERERVRLVTAVAELVANVIEHGRTPDGRPPRMVVALRAEPARVVAELSDDGIGYPPDGSLPDDALAEHGRGLALVRAILDHVDYDRRGGANHWRLELERAG